MLHRIFGGLIAVAVLVAGQMENSAFAKDRYGIAVIVGNKNYKGRVPNVDYAHNDAEAFKQYIIKVLGYREGNVIDLRDATMSDLVAAFGKKDNHKGQLYNFVRPNKSNVVVFYSGHGAPSQKTKKGYLVPVDAHPDAVELNGYPIDVLYENLAKISSKSTTVFLDACFSGDSPKGMLIRSASPVYMAAKAAVPVKGITVLTAASGQQLASWDEKAKHGLFTKYLLTGLYGAADKKDIGGDGDGHVSLGELKNWLDEEMTYQARRQYSREQNATVNGDKSVIFAAIPPNAKFVPVRAPETGTTKSRPVVRKVSVTEMDIQLYAQQNANMRMGPSATNAKIGRIRAGEAVSVTGKVKGSNWYRIEQSNGKQAYVFARLLGKNAPTAQPTGTQTNAVQAASVPVGTNHQSYGILPIKIRGKVQPWAMAAVQRELQNLPDAQIFQGSVARNARFLVTGVVTRMQITKEANPDHAGEKFARGILSGMLGGIGKAMIAESPPNYNIVDMQVVVNAKDRHTGKSVVERGIYFNRLDGRKNPRKLVVPTLRSAFRQAAERLATRLAGARPPRLREPHQIREAWARKRAREAQENSRNDTYSD